MQFSFTTSLSLAPGFSPVLDRHKLASRFNGFSARPEAAEAAGEVGGHCVTGLKPGANERIIISEVFENSLQEHQP
jgi:hypothetical protein